MKKRIIILGSTGSIGRNTLAVLEGMRDEWEVVGLAAGSRWQELAAQANMWRPEAVALADADALSKMGDELDCAPKIFTGLDALVELKRAHPQLPVLMVSASTAKGVMEEPEKLGAEGYVLKPFEPKDLMDKIHGILGTAGG